MVKCDKVCCSWRTVCELQGKSGLSLESAESSTQCWDGMSTQFSVLNWNSFSQGDPEEILPDKTCFPCFKWTNFRWSELGEGEEKNRDQSKLILFLFYYYTHTHTHILKG